MSQSLRSRNKNSTLATTTTPPLKKAATSGTSISSSIITTVQGEQTMDNQEPKETDEVFVDAVSPNEEISDLSIQGNNKQDIHTAPPEYEKITMDSHSNITLLGSDRSHESSDTTGSDTPISLMQISNSLKYLTDTMSKLDSKNDSLNKKFDKLHTDITTELATHRTSYDDKLDALEKKLLDDQNVKHTELTEVFKTQKSETTEEVISLKTEIATIKLSLTHYRTRSLPKT
jgi:hypothetical protein